MLPGEKSSFSEVFRVPRKALPSSNVGKGKTAGTKCKMFYPFTNLLLSIKKKVFLAKIKDHLTLW